MTGLTPVIGKDVVSCRSLTMIKTKNYLSLLLFILLAFAPAVFAGDYANLNFIGFSKDGKYLAFEEYGTQDGSGYPYANIYFVDVAKNAYVGKPFKAYIEKEMATEAAARAKVKTAAAAKMRELKIVQGNTGTHTVSKLMNEYDVDNKDKPEGGKVRFAEIIGSMYQRGDYTLSLNQTKTMTKDCEGYGDDMFKIELTLKNNEENTVKALQKDATLPPSRGCTINYRIQEVYVYEGQIAVFLNMFYIGFEGPDMRFMVVTGKLE